MLVALFATTMFVSAMLLFIVQPMVAKLLLPELGGSAAVWTTCMLFFQGMLLCGYGYAHAGARWLSPRTQAIVHGVVTVAALASLPIAIPVLDIDVSAWPTLWLLLALTLAVGLPFFALSTTAPMLQHWFAHTDHADASDPYFLYAASNIGSMVALLGYPLVVEPTLGVSAQTSAWALLYLAFVALLVVSMTRVFGVRESRARSTTTTAQPVTWRDRALWVVFAAIPSSLLLGLTQYITTDVAPVPLLWVLPLALYLLTFILVFAKRPLWLPDHARTWLPIVCLVVFVARALKLEMWIEVLLHLVNFFLFTLFFHGALAQRRPDVARLTEFFFFVSVGGVVGGLFNALVAPFLFDRAIDYHLMIVVGIACIAPAASRSDPLQGNRWALPIVVAAVSFAYLYHHDFWSFDEWPMFLLAGAIVAAYAVIGAKATRWENVALGVIFALGAHTSMQTRGLITYERSFFAAYKVFDFRGTRKFSHGTTGHGTQSLDPELAATPLSYHHPSGPVGQVLAGIPHSDVLVVGLGAGAMASYANENAHFDIVEIDPLVEEIAREYFTYLDLCGANCTVTIRDGRRYIEESTKMWDIIFLDAYNSDAVPTHLLTREALELYAAHLTPGGVIVFHVSNRYLDIEGIVGTVAADAGFAAITQFHNPPPRDRRSGLIDRSKYTAVARTRAELDALWATGNWRETRASGIHWTDDFSNLIDVVMW